MMFIRLGAVFTLLFAAMALASPRGHRGGPLGDPQIEKSTSCVNPCDIEYKLN